MKKFFTFLTPVIFALTSCQKEVATNSSANSVKNSSPAISASSNGDIIVKDDLTGLQVMNFCTGETLTATQGTAIINIAPDGNLRSINVHDVVFTDIYGNVYRGIYVVTFTPIGLDGFNNTYKMVLSPQGGTNHMVLQGELHVFPTGTGGFNAVIDKFFIKCP
jgi:hypothetical protein